MSPFADQLPLRVIQEGLAAGPASGIVNGRPGRGFGGSRHVVCFFHHHRFGHSCGCCFAIFSSGCDGFGSAFRFHSLLDPGLRLVGDHVGGRLAGIGRTGVGLCRFRGSVENDVCRIGRPPHFVIRVGRGGRHAGETLDDAAGGRAAGFRPRGRVTGGPITAPGSSPCRADQHPAGVITEFHPVVDFGGRPPHHLHRVGRGPRNHRLPLKDPVGGSGGEGRCGGRQLPGVHDAVAVPVVPDGGAGRARPAARGAHQEALRVVLITNPIVRHGGRQPGAGDGVASGFPDHRLPLDDAVGVGGGRGAGLGHPFPGVDRSVLIRVVPHGLGGARRGPPGGPPQNALGVVLVPHPTVRHSGGVVKDRFRVGERFVHHGLPLNHAVGVSRAEGLGL